MRPWFPTILLCLSPFSAGSRDFKIPAGLTEIPELAESVLAEARVAPTADPAVLFPAQLAAGLYRDALGSLDRLRAPLLGNPSPRIRARYIQYVLYAQSELQSSERKVALDVAYRDAFHALFDPLDDRTASSAASALDIDNLSVAQRVVQQELDRLKGKTSISLGDALQLLHDYNNRQINRVSGPAISSLIAEDDAHRYSIQKDIRVLTADGATVCVLVVRPRQQARLPALLQFTIYNDPGALLRDARRSAANGYVGVIGLTRGKGCGSGEMIPYEHDGADAAELIDWIGAQPWSDGQVGMYGGSYSGFTPWAAAKFHPKALKTIMVGAPNAPGIDSPMEGNVFWNFIYPWPFYTTGNKTLDEETYNDTARWERLNRNWYLSGRAYRDLEKIDGTPNPIFDRWLDHPSYDAYWQGLIPFKRQFSGIDIPILQTAGYYFGGPGAAVYYLREHYRYNPRAQHYLLIGPYDHFMAQRGTASADGNVESFSGYKLDPVALIDLVELRYRWFDHVLKGAPKPEILSDKINYEVTGANLWKHAASISAMAPTRRRYFLGSGKRGGGYRLDTREAATGSVRQIIDFKDRHDAAGDAPGGGVQDTVLDSSNGLVFTSEPLASASELSGLFSGHLDFAANKKDFDYQISLYELTASGDYIQLAPFWSRASFVDDISQPHLLSPGKRQSLDFESMRLMSRQLAAGSRIVAVLAIIKEPGREINYGTGTTVSAETIADAQIPLNITWFTSSYIDLPGAN